MINPNKIIDFNRTDAQLQELIMFLVVVAGKKATTMARILDKFLNHWLVKGMSPFQAIKEFDGHSVVNTSLGFENYLESQIKLSGFGQYNRVSRAFRELANSNLNLRTCSLEDLMSIHGIGRKSASCFLAWTRPNVRVAMLDTHLLKELVRVRDEFKRFSEAGIKTAKKFKYVEKYYDINIPKSTPSSKKLYNLLETFWLEICDSLGVDSTEHDLEVWKRYSK